VLKKKGYPQAITICPKITNMKDPFGTTNILIQEPAIVSKEAITRHTLRPPRFDPKILMAKKLKGMKKIEKTSEHIEIIKFSS
jgi:hypothetical protein